MEFLRVFLREIGFVEVSTDLMYNLLRLLAAIIFLLIIYFTLRKKEVIRLTFLLDSRGGGKDLLSAWGLSIFIDVHGKQILFDVGPNWSLIINNADTLKLPLHNVDYIVISHWHNDHAGGLGSALRYYSELGKDVKVYVPEEKVLLPEANVIVCKEPTKLFNDVLTTGALGYFTKEQALIIGINGKGPLVIIGCAHPGIELILDHVTKVTGSKRIYGVIGGYHIGKSEAHELLKVLKTYKVKVIAPAHCTSNEAIKILKQGFKGKFIDVRTGVDITL